MDYVGRFAPTPSGPLHIGSLLTAVASYLDARSHNGTWQLHIDDIDQPRVVPGSAVDIANTLKNHGMFWDEETVYQSDFHSSYQRAISDLECKGLVFYCSCTRSMRPANTPYPGRCRHVTNKPDYDHAIRLHAADVVISFEDRLHGKLRANLAEHVGDFQIQRRDGIHSYPLTAVIGCIETGVTAVVRGADLLDMTYAQLYLLSLLDLTPPSYLHIPVITDRNAIKLSKRDQATAVDNRYPVFNLTACLQLLGIEPPRLPTVDRLMDWAVGRWGPSNLNPTCENETYFAL